MADLPVIPQTLLDQTRDPSFWEEYFMWDAWEEYPHEIHATCRFGVAPGYALILEGYVDSRVYGLHLEAGGSEPVEIATDDDAHPFPDVLRWEEVELVSRCVALAEPSLPHPGITVLLLCRFAPICVDDDLSTIVSLLDAAWKSVPAMDPKDITRHIERLDSRDAGLRWSKTAVDWVLEAPDRDPYSFRVEGNEAFPFEGMKALRKAASETLSASHVPPAAVSRSERQIRPRFSLELRIPHILRATDRTVTLPGSDREVVMPAYGGAWRQLDLALREAGAGTAGPGGGTYSPNLQLRETQWTIEVRGDLDAGVAIIRSAARELDLPDGIKLELKAPPPRRPIEL